MCDGTLFQQLVLETGKACLVVAVVSGNIYILVMFTLLYARPSIDVIRSTQWQHTEAQARFQHTNCIQR